MKNEKLLNNFNFHGEVIDVVSDVADRFRKLSYSKIEASLPATTKFSYQDDRLPISVLDIIPKNDFEDVLVYHLPMGNDINSNMKFLIATIREALPNKRIIVTGNTAEPGQNSAKLAYSDIWEIHLGNVKSLIKPVVRYLANQAINETIQVGYSYGAEKTAMFSSLGHFYNQKITKSIILEPVAIKKRKFIDLAYNFLRSGLLMEDYVKETNCLAYEEARNLATIEGRGTLGYLVGLGRLGNLAISAELAKNNFFNRISTALIHQPQMKSVLGWGKNSELASNHNMLELVTLLKDSFGPRINDLSLDDQTHAMGDNIFLQLALILQSFKILED